MGSRIKEKPQKIFDLFFEAARPTFADDDPQVLRQFPSELDDQESIQMLPKFCFPFDVERVKESPTVQHFTVALTDMEGKQHFGFCRMAMGFHTCLCILSYLPWFEVFYKILNMIADHLAKEQFTELDEFLSTLYLHPMPNLSSPISLEFDPKVSKLKISSGKDLKKQDKNQDLDPGTTSALYFIAPDHGKLPTIPENRNLTEFVVALDVNNMLQLYASLLHERRILLTTSKLSTLTACVQASSAMLYPMHWQHIYIPVLPPHLLDYCCAPMPYLIGVHTSLMERVQSRALEDVVILNIESNTLESPFQDLENLPSDVVSLLKYQLKKQSAGDGVARAFLRAQALLFGSYREALICNPGQPITFCQDTFLQQGSGAVQAFLQQAVHLQLFKQFIDDRLEKLNAGEDFSDLFEQEINRTLSPGNMHSYQLWVENLKKGGGALLSTMKKKANPAVRNVYQYAKVHAKIGLKNMRTRLMEKDASTGQHRHQRHSFNNDHISGPILPTRSKQSENLQSRLPITQHFGKSRPRRPQRQSSQTELQTQSTASLDFPLGPNDVSEGDENLHPDFLDAGGLDLLGEIFETLSLLEPSQGGRPLYGTRSLDFCNLEDRSSYTKLRSSRETLHESLFEGQDAGDSLVEDTTLLPKLEQEDTQSTLLPFTEFAGGSNESRDHDLSETQVILGPEKATVPEEEEMIASDSYELSQVSWTQNTDHETSSSSENVIEKCPAMESEEEARVDQTLDPPPAIPTPKAEPPTSTCSNSQSFVASLQKKISAKTDFIVKESSPSPGQITSLHQPLVSRPLTQTKVKELKKRFEA
ncbi:DENN domain-containing protein 1C [Tiliqua scincoides]|uniref:DENN domain-containing protein 1C n=1 Tax=Tiliqua scincoides TaxID=71010 RepID=UPI0034630EBF